MNLYKKFGTENTLERDGIELEIMEGVSFTIARSGGANKAFDRAMKNKYLPLQRQLERDLVSPKRLKAISIDIYSSTIILGWKGVTDKNGKELPFNKDNCTKILNDLPAVFDCIVEEARRLENFQLNDVEEAVTKLKNG